ncbi:MAG: hypothetical protein M1828_002229 [Chrysothrix sp. TS-e1954]|nr:MAG: hypothetical protein M1828_002229 [Chrysothrix sp. TS-e1954]
MDRKHSVESPEALLPSPKRSKLADHELFVTYKIRFVKNLEYDWIRDVTVTAHAVTYAVNHPYSSTIGVEDVTSVKDSASEDAWDWDIKQLKAKEARMNDDHPDDHADGEQGVESQNDDEGEASIQDTIEDEDESDPDPNEVGRAFGRLLHRRTITPEFWSSMEEPSENTSRLAFKVFDRRGRLQGRHKCGSRTGSGVWGAELDGGNMLLLERMEVSEQWRRRGIASNMFKIMFSRAEASIEGLSFAFTFPAVLKTHAPRYLAKEDETRLLSAAIRRSQKFARKVGFRRIACSPWFALACDPGHVSHTLKASEDLESPEKRTELEKLERALEKSRTIRKLMSLRRMDYSDKFRGHQESDVERLLALKGLNNTPEQRQMMRYGCTCRKCIGGFLSPRMRDELLCLAEETYDMVDLELNDQEIGTSPREILLSCQADLFPHIEDQDLQENMLTNKSLRTGFNNVSFCGPTTFELYSKPPQVYKYAASCLRNDLLPTTVNMLAVYMASSEWPPCTRNFFQKGGRSRDVISALVAGAVTRDNIEEGFETEQGALPECRNDKEFGFVLGLLLEEGKHSFDRSRINLAALKVPWI